MFGKYCFCTGTIVSPPPSSGCPDCLQAKKILIGCGQGLKPCGNTTSINLEEYNNNVMDVTYSLYQQDIGLESATISPEGLLEIETGDTWHRGKTYDIVYRVQETEKGLMRYETVTVCVDNPCNTGCADCNKCTGECFNLTDKNLTVNCGVVGATINITTGANIAACSGTITYSIVSTTPGLSATISNAGLVTYSTSAGLAAGHKGQIVYKLSCIDGLEGIGVINITIPDLCANVSCGAGEKCDPCTGLCVNATSDLGATQSGVGHTSGNTGLSFN